MQSSAHKEEYRRLVSINEALHGEYMRENDAWRDSPFAWIKTRPSRTIGAIGEKMVASWLAMHDFSVARSPDSEADRIVEGRRVEIKFSTLWENGSYRFQQIRDQNYDLIIMLGISPHDAHCWVLEKSKAFELREAGVIEGQHSGHDGSDTAWIQLRPENDNPWFSPYGNTLDAALGLISGLTGYKPAGLTGVIDG